MQKYWIPMLLLAAACGSGAEPAPVEQIEETINVGTNGGELPVPSAVVGTCRYSNPFSGGPECRSYDSDWSESEAEEDCSQQQGELSTEACPTDDLIGRCATPVEESRVTIVFAYGEPAGCQATGFACTTFAQGTWEPTAMCDGDPPPTPQSSVFQPPELICKAPLDGEAPGQSANGDVCTWQLISGATEEGRRFQDYASCDVVRTQRPYYAYGRPDDAERDDPRMQDPTYVAELNWVKSQIDSTACVCCHKSSVVPDGVSNWDIEQPGNFMNGFYDTGLALGANWLNSVALGAFPPEENNGFDRDISGIPSTDPERMRDFFAAELTYRGRTQQDFADSPPFGGPLFDQIYYEPEACPDGVGLAADGTITWEGGGARYIYLLRIGSLSPTIPPNLDRPEGTLWRLDVEPSADALASGSIKVGEVPAGTSQVIPDGEQPAIDVAERYYLYVSADVGAPITRCITR